MKRAVALFLLLLFLWTASSAAQQAPPGSALPPPRNTPSDEFLKAADEVLAEMSKILSLPVLSPLKKSLRSKEEIRAYVIRRMQEDKQPAKRYADQKLLEKLGLVPKGFQVDAFLVELLTEQIAGLYDPKDREFFIADWINPGDQRMVMAHELTHALQDQHFRVDPWVDAAKPNDDAELGRDAVLEGSALVAMLDFMIAGQGRSVRDLPINIEDMAGPLMGDTENAPELAKAPPFIRDALLFPYLSGAGFTQKILQATSGWADFHKVFEKPPVSTQQILHPDLYLSDVAPSPVTLPDFSKLVPGEYKELDENVLGEFGVREVLKQFLGETRAKRLAAAWAGDRYAIFENQKTKEALLVHRVRLASAADAARYFGNYSETLELKYEKRRDLFRRPNFFSFQTDDGAVFLLCVADECVTAEGTTRAVFDRITRALGWPAGPTAPAMPSPPAKKTTIAAVAQN